MRKFCFGLIYIFAAASRVLAQDAPNLSRSERSLLQPEMEIEVPTGGFNKVDYATGDWWGYRKRLFE